MKEKKKPLQGGVGIVLLLAAMIVLFYSYTMQNKARIEEQNKNYAADCARQTAVQINEDFRNAQNLMKTYAYFIEKNLTEPKVSVELLKEIESSSVFDAFRFTDANGINYASDGQTSDASDSAYYKNGIKGESGMSENIDRVLFNDTMIGFYVPIRYKGRIIGVLRGAYMAEKHLGEMLKTNFFGVAAEAFLCTRDGVVIAGSGAAGREGDLIREFEASGFIDKNTAEKAKAVFENGGEGSFVCDSNSKTDNLCVVTLRESQYVLVQTFPESVTQTIIDNANRAGIMLEIALIGLFVAYIVAMILRNKRSKKELEQENREMGYVISGVNTLFSRFAMVDFENNTYQYLAGTTPEDSGLADRGSYRDLRKYLTSLMIADEDRQEFAEMIHKDTLINELRNKEDVRYQCHVMRSGSPEWEHVNVVCLERKDGVASKVLFIRQNITAIKEQELRIQAEMARADRKERQYQVAITSNASCTFEFNLTKDLVERDILCTIDGKQISMLEGAGIPLPCKMSECLEKWKKFVSPESMEDYSFTTNLNYLKRRFEKGEAEVAVEYWTGSDYRDGKICVQLSFFMARDYETNDIMVMGVTKDITERVIKQKQQMDALQDALMQAQHANRAKTTFLSNMSHDIRTPMNAIIGFATIAVSHIDNKEQVRDCLQKVLSSSNHLLSLINDILDMSRIESGKVQIKEKECNISELMHNLVNIIQPQVKAKQLELFIDTFDVANEDVIADALKLNQVFINLLSNAVKYTPAGGTVTFRIRQKTTYNHGYGDYIFTIKDNGIGMAPDFVKHIFEPFERESSVTQTGIQGTGLGMAITKNIVEMMNGKISVESESGKGSTFTVEISLRLQDTESNAEQIKELEGLRSLVVDDDFHTCDSVSKMLKQIGLRAEWTTSGREAVYRAKSAYEEGDSYHTYIVDWQMPETSGVETARRIRSVVGNEAPIIILTAYDWTDIEEEAKEAGISAFCAKPLFMSDLKSVLLAANNLADKKQEEAAAWTKADFNGKRILLVEDIELNREIAEVILTETGFVVETAPDGTDAVAMVKNSAENYYDAILMDVQMPIMNGYEATRTIRTLPRNDVRTLPIIAMTANALEEDKEAALKNGMNAHISKPIDTDVFIEVLGRFLN